VNGTTRSPKRKGKKLSGIKGLGEEAAGILRHCGQVVVVDTDSDYLYIGKLLGVSGPFITLGEADVHDRRESSSMNEKYVLESKKYGVRSNRREVHIRMERIVSYSLLDDVIEY
jgi:CO dehydrogenase nickel-insertion accessory protein CooC1